MEVGPFAVIEAGVELGEGCRVDPYVHLTGCVIAGARNVFGTGSVLGGAPQDVRYRGEVTRLRIGNENVFREHVTVHSANSPEEDTQIGSNGFFMAHAHIGHNACIGDRVIIANGALVGGHAVIGDRAFISGTCLVHQFVRVGTLALMQGGSGVSKDLPPFCVARGNNGICGLNVVGLRRAGMDMETRLELRRIYRALFRSGLSLRAAVEAAMPLMQSEWGRLFVEFVRASRRGVVVERGFRPSESRVQEAIRLADENE